jgi:hypothetical protein
MPYLEDSFRKERGAWLVGEIEQAIEDRADLDGKLQLIRSLYWMDKDPLPRTPWPGASDIHLPVVYEKIENSVPKVVNAFWGTEPIVHVRRVAEEFLPEETDAAERVLNWGLEENIYPNFYETSESWFRNALRDGMSTLKIYWERKWEKTVEVHKLKAVWAKGQINLQGVAEMEDRVKTPDEVLEEVFGKPTVRHGLIAVEDLGRDEYDENDSLVPELLGHKFYVEFVEERRRHRARVVFKPSEYVDEVDIHVYREVLKHDCPRVEVIEHEDLIVPFRTQNLDEADWVAQQFWLTRDEVQRKVDDGSFNMSEEELDRIMSRSPETQEELETNEELKRQKDRVIGEGEKEQVRQSASRDGEEDLVTDDRKMLFYEVYVLDDVDDDGEPIEVIYYICHALRAVVGCEYLSEIFPHNRRPFATIKYKTISDRWYATGMGEVLVPINLEVNTIINFVNNNQELINNPFFFYIPAAVMADPGILSGISPGDGIPIGDINGVSFPKFQQEPLANLSAMDSLLLFADRITMSPMNAGSPQVRNAPRTARGTLALLSEGNIQLDNIITRWQRTGWEELMHQLMGLYQSYMPDEKYVLVTGSAGELKRTRITPQDIRGRHTFQFTGNTVNTNREVLRTLAQVRYNTVMTHPDYAQDPVVRREALKDFLRHYSEGVDIDRLVPAMPGQGGYQHPPMSQDSENQAMLHGVQLDALPTDDHAGHLAAIERFQRSEAFAVMSEDRVILFAMHMKQHQEFLMQQQRMAQSPVAPGQGNNVPSGMSQGGGTDMDALEGGVQ